MKKPRILIPSASHPDHGPRVFVNLPYIRALEEAGALLLLTGRPKDDGDLDALAGLADGLFLCGGSDMEPQHYGKNMCPHVKNPDPERDALELGLLRHADQKGIPVFGICRGMQVMNVHAGGALFRDLEDERTNTIKHDNHDNKDRGVAAHEITVQPDTILARMIGPGTFGVNSLHHQGVNGPGSGLRVSATAPDGLVEAIERTDRPFWLGVQWHPEELRDPVWKNLFKEFVEAARGAGTVREAQAIMGEPSPVAG